MWPLLDHETSEWDALSFYKSSGDPGILEWSKILRMGEISSFCKKEGALRGDISLWF